MPFEDIGTTKRKAMPQMRILKIWEDQEIDMAHAIDVAGMRFGKLVAVRREGRIKQGVAWSAGWLCQCDCGETTVAAGTDLRKGLIKSCGCLLKHATTHGLSKDPVYASYKAMISRCHNPEAKDYARYGAWGIAVCDLWRFGDDDASGLEYFAAHIGQKPTREHTVDRIRNELGYEPGNVRWATPTEQARNRRNNYFGPGVDARAVCDLHGVNYSTFRARIAKGWSIEAALVPPQKAKGGV